MENTFQKLRENLLNQTTKADKYVFMLKSEFKRIANPEHIKEHVNNFKEKTQNKLNRISDWAKSGFQKMNKNQIAHEL